MRLLHAGVRLLDGGGVLPPRPGGLHELDPGVAPRAERQPLSLHRIPPDPRRRRGARGAGSRRPSRPAPGPTAAAGPGDHRRGRRRDLRPSGRPRGRAGRPRRARATRWSWRGRPISGSRSTCAGRGRRTSWPSTGSPELRELSTGDGRVTIGAALTLSEVEEALAGRVPLLDEVWPQFASRLIRNGATIGGNLGTASPIGDLAPALLALDATLVLVSSAGEREVPLADYFTGYRQTLRSRAELIRAVRLPAEQPGIVAFHKIAKRRYDDISSVAVGFALDVTEGVVTSVRIGLGGVAATPIRALRTELALAGQPWTEEWSRRPPPCSPTRARPSTTSGPRRRTAPRCSATACGSCGPPEVSRQDCAPRPGGGAMTSLSERPTGAVVGVEMEHESAALHVTGQALYTDDLVGRTVDVLHAHPVQAPHAHARVTAIRADAAYDVPGVVRVLTAGDVPGHQRRGGQARRAALPRRGEVSRPRRRLGAGRDPRGGPAGRGGDRGRLRAAAVAGHGARGDRRRQLPGRARRPSSAATSTWAFDNAAHVFTGETEMAGQEHFYLETQASLALVDEGGQVFVQCSTQHPTETQEIVAHVLGVPEPRGDRAVPADGRRLRGQGDAAARVRRHRGPRGDHHRPPGAAAPAAPAGHHDDRQAARLPRRVEGRLRRGRPPARARGHDHLRTAGGASTCRSRCWPARCATSTTPTGSRTCGCTAASRRRTSPRRRPSGASAGRRACS